MGSRAHCAELSTAVALLGRRGPRARRSPARRGRVGRSRACPASCARGSRARWSVVEGEENDGKNCVGGVARGMRRGLGFGCLGHVGGFLQNVQGIMQSSMKNTEYFNARTVLLFGGAKLDCRLISKKMVGVFGKYTGTRVITWRRHQCSECCGASNLEGLLITLDS